MEAFSLLKYWRGRGGAGDATAPVATLATTDTTSAAAAATAILTAVAQNDVEETDDDDSDNENEDDDGPFFDLEFTLPDDSEDSPQNLNEKDHTVSDSENHSDEQENINNTKNNNDDNSSEDSEGDEEGESEREIKFTLSPSTSSNDHSDPNLSDDVVFKGELVQLEPSSFVLNSSSSSEPNCKPQVTARASLLKSATKFRVFMLGLKKPNKPDNVSAASEKDPNRLDPVAPNPKQQRKLFTVKFKVEEVPIMSLLFTRSDNSSKGGKAASSAAATSANSKEDSQTESHPSHSSSASEEKRLMRKYLRMVKPLYVKVSRRYAEKLRFSGQLNMTASASASAPTAEKEKEGDNIAAAAASSEALGANGKGQKQGNLPLPAGLRVVCKHLGKSRSASSVAAPAPAPVSAPDPAGLVSSKRRDDSLLQQQDGIQGAILHCKRSFNASRDQCESSQLPRSVSDPLHEVSPELSRKSTNEGAMTNALA